MKVKVTKKKNKIIFEVNTSGRKRTKKYHILLKDMINTLSTREDLTNYSLVTSESHGDLLPSMTSARYVFEKKAVDIEKKSVIIDEPKIEAEHPIIEEPKKEASLTSETLPYGLKSTTTKTTKKTTAKKKRTTKKKTTEE